MKYFMQSSHQCKTITLSSSDSVTPRFHHNNDLSDTTVPITEIVLEVHLNAIGGFHVTSYQANFASHRTRVRHVGFLFTSDGIGKSNKMFHYFLFSSFHITKLTTK